MEDADLTLMKTIARLAKALPQAEQEHDQPRVLLGCTNREAVELFARLSGKRRETAWNGSGSEHDYVIVSAEFVVAGVSFQAQYDRPATAEESAKLAAQGAETTERKRLSVVG
jgi:hypothetical protein